MLSTQEALALVKALVRQLPRTSFIQPEYRFSVVAQRSPREPIVVDCRALRVTLQLNFAQRTPRKLLARLSELMDLLAWLAVCPGCTVAENTQLWQEIVQLIVHDAIFSGTIVFGDATNFPRWILSFKPDFKEYRDTGSGQPPLDRHHRFVQALFAQTLGDAGSYSNAYAQALLRVRTLVESATRQPLAIPIGVDLDFKRKRNKRGLHMLKKLPEFVMALRTVTAPNRIQFDSFGLMMDDGCYTPLDTVDQVADMAQLICDVSDVWVSRMLVHMPNVHCGIQGTDLFRRRRDYGSMLNRLLRDQQPGEPPLCIQLGASMDFWQASIARVGVVR
ncbi:hypothetical protein P43SY_012129 [Pythium insidiosum]|uniref:Uncharacterized protein n=1 Tax=Pythium insidiosum TaxID=114742 RepID=A0AAD5L5S1_PYTIN|nr:hypothetical protein P43SY_012129 [Pythium insidiosum]